LAGWKIESLKSHFFLVRKVVSIVLSTQTHPTSTRHQGSALKHGIIHFAVDELFSEIKGITDTRRTVFYSPCLISFHTMELMFLQIKHKP